MYCWCLGPGNLGLDYFVGIQTGQPQAACVSVPASIGFLLARSASGVVDFGGGRFSWLHIRVVKLNSTMEAQPALFLYVILVGLATSDAICLRHRVFSEPWLSPC